MSISSRSEAGFSLVETIVATALLATAVVTLAQLFAVAVRRNLASRDTTYATILAVQKLEELREIAWDADQGGAVDYIDQFGRTLGGGGTPPANAVYTRRWVVQPLPADPDNTLIIQVLVGRQREAARLVTVKTRNAP
jgi:hypothetical protein